MVTLLQATTCFNKYCCVRTYHFFFFARGGGHLFPRLFRLRAEGTSSALRTTTPVPSAHALLGFVGYLVPGISDGCTAGRETQMTAVTHTTLFLSIRFVCTLFNSIPSKNS